MREDRVNMAKYQIPHTCGHIAEHQIAGPEKHRPAQRLPGKPKGGWPAEEVYSENDDIPRLPSSFVMLERMGGRVGRLFRLDRNPNYDLRTMDDKHEAVGQALIKAEEEPTIENRDAYSEELWDYGEHLRVLGYTGEARRIREMVRSTRRDTAEIPSLGIAPSRARAS